MPKPIELTQSRQLLVEGRDAFHFFEALCSHLSLDDVQVQDFGGIYELSNFLQAFVLMPSFNNVVTNVGIVRDAETEAESAFRSVEGSLTDAGLELSVPPQRVGRIGQMASVFVLPDGKSSGVLETLLWRSIEDSEESRCVVEFIQCLERVSGKVIQRRDKAMINAYLSSTNEPQVSVGIASRRTIWNFDHEAFKEIRGFVVSF